MFSRKKRQKENPPPINPNIDGILNNAMRNRLPQQTSVIEIYPADPRGQTPGMRIQQSRKTTMVAHVDPASPQGQTPRNSITAGPSAPAHPAQVSSSPSTSSTSVKKIAISVIIGVLFVIAALTISNDMLIVTLLGGAVSGIIKTWTRKASPSNSRERSSSQFTASVRDQLGSESDQTIERFFIGIARDRSIRFTRQQLHSFTNNFSEKLGDGGFGTVFKGEFSGANIAVKVLRRDVDKRRVKEQFMAEVGTLGRTNHINLVKLYGYCFDQSMKALVYEYHGNGSLDRFLFYEKFGSLDWEKLRNIAIGTAKGIAYLHEECQQRIIHYDIKPGNVLLDTNWNPKVADFGLAKLCNRDSTHVTMSRARGGTPGYAAPELWFPTPVTEKCDIYSYGMLLFEIVGRRKNLNINMSRESQEWFPRWVWEKHEQQNWEAILYKCGVEEQHRHKVREVLLVALTCVQYNPESRPPMSDVVKMLEGGMEVPLPPNPFDQRQGGAAGCTEVCAVIAGVEAAEERHGEDVGRWNGGATSSQFISSPRCCCWNRDNKGRWRLRRG